MNLLEQAKSRGHEVALLGAGCFWSPEAEYRAIKGVVATAVGYSGGLVENPTYRMVCEKNTGHAEVVLVEFDPAVITYREILEHFYKMHSGKYHTPGDQYRSAIFTYSDEQKAIADEVVAETRKHAIINTEVTPATEFWIAEDYHQQYKEKRGHAFTQCGVLSS